MPSKTKKRSPGASASEKFLRILALVALVAIFALSGLQIAQNQSTTAANTTPTANGSPTALTFPTVPSGGTPLVLDKTYFHPSLMFSIPHILGWDLPPDGEEKLDPTNGLKISRAGATFINSNALSVVHVFIERDPDRKAKVVADLDAYYDKKNLDAAWSNFTGGYKETGRHPDGDKFVIDFQLFLNGNTYLGRQVSQFDGDWLKVSRLVTPNNNSGLMDALQKTVWAAFTVYPAEASLPIAWPSVADPVLGYAVRYSPDWAQVAGTPGAAFIVSGPLRGASITMTTNAVPDKAIKAEADARAWVMAANASATVQTVQAATINGINGFNISYIDPDSDGNPRSAVSTLLNGPDGNLVSLTFVSSARNLDLLGTGATVPPELAEVRTTLMLIPKSQLIPTLTPTITPTASMTSTPTATPDVSNTPTASSTLSSTPSQAATAASTAQVGTAPATQSAAQSLVSQTATIALTTSMPTVSTTQPTAQPTIAPTTISTDLPTTQPPTIAPTTIPTDVPTTIAPTIAATLAPTDVPATIVPTTVPTDLPTAASPTALPPTNTPSS